jgi:hypothetical protein
VTFLTLDKRSSDTGAGVFARKRDSALTGPGSFERICYSATGELLNECGDALLASPACGGPALRSGSVVAIIVEDVDVGRNDEGVDHGVQKQLVFLVDGVKVKLVAPLNNLAWRPCIVLSFPAEQVCVYVCVCVFVFVCVCVCVCVCVFVCVCVCFVCVCV